MSELSTVPYALVVEDDPLILMNACDIVEAAGFRYFEAADGDTAKPLIDEHGASIVLLFTDIEMPGETNGLELAHYAAKRFPEIAVVVASGRPHPAPGDLPDGARFFRKAFQR
jgi:DNA-binding NtrC family response regulator